MVIRVEQASLTDLQRWRKTQQGGEEGEGSWSRKAGGLASLVDMDSHTAEQNNCRTIWKELRGDEHQGCRWVPGVFFRV